MKIFVSLPMHGLSIDDVIARQRTVLTYFGHEDDDLIDNVTHAELPITAPRVAHLGYSISMMGDADLVIFDHNWSKAKGCMVEMLVCKLYDIPYTILK